MVLFLMGDVVVHGFPCRGADAEGRVSFLPLETG